MLGEYSAQPLLRCENVRVAFGGIVALDRVSLDVPAGQIVGVIGPNGAGKTTLFNCISRLYECGEGDIVFKGSSLLTQPRQKIAALGIARTFQNVALFESMSVRENVLVGTHPHRAGGFLSDALKTTSREDIAKNEHIADDMLALLELQADAERPVRDLPFGTRKRVELARALAANPALLMLDEPAGGLNHYEVEGLKQMIMRLREQRNLTVLLVEHHMQFVMSLCDSLVVLNFGRRIANGTPEEVQRNPEVIQAYLGGAA